jgi:hypothetical protein
MVDEFQLGIDVSFMADEHAAIIEDGISLARGHFTATRLT